MEYTYIMKRVEQIVVIFIAAGLAIPSYWFFWTLAGGGGYNRRVKPLIQEDTLSKPSTINHPEP